MATKNKVHLFTLSISKLPIWKYFSKRKENKMDNFKISIIENGEYFD